MKKTRAFMSIDDDYVERRLENGERFTEYGDYYSAEKCPECAYIIASKFYGGCCRKCGSLKEPIQTAGRYFRSLEGTGGFFVGRGIRVISKGFIEREQNVKKRTNRKRASKQLRKP